MKCPKCGGKTRVRDNVNDEQANERYRRRLCKSCGHEFYTIEFEIEDDDQLRETWSRNHRSRTKSKTYNLKENDHVRKT